MVQYQTISKLHQIRNTIHLNYKKHLYNFFFFIIIFTVVTFDMYKWLSIYPFSYYKPSIMLLTKVLPSKVTSAFFWNQWLPPLFTFKNFWVRLKMLLEITKELVCQVVFMHKERCISKYFTKCLWQKHSSYKQNKTSC